MAPPLGGLQPSAGSASPVTSPGKERPSWAARPLYPLSFTESSVLCVPSGSHQGTGIQTPAVSLEREADLLNPHPGSHKLISWREGGEGTERKWGWPRGGEGEGRRESCALGQGLHPPSVGLQM